MGNVLAILGSPRVESNSTCITETFLHEYHRVRSQDTIMVKKLQSMRIQACTGCEMCKRLGNGCVLKDDMNVLYPLVRGADTLVYSTPVYWWGVSGQLKVFLDRLHALDHGIFSGKRLVVITTGADALSGIQYQLIQRQFQEICEYLSIKFAGYLPVSADDEHPVASNPSALDAARELAKLVLA